MVNCRFQVQRALHRSAFRRDGAAPQYLGKEMGNLHIDRPQVVYAAHFAGPSICHHTMPIKPHIHADAIAQLFTEAHTQNGWLPDPVPETTLRELHRLTSLAPTSMNCQPMRLVFLTTAAAKERLIATLSPGNVDKTRQAPVTAIVATDTQFYEHMPQIWQGAGARDMFAGNPPLATITATRNGTLGGAYLILAARAVGLDCGPMSGFDNAKVDAEFFADGRFKSNFICSLGVGDPAKVRPRNARLSFEQACEVL